MARAVWYSARSWTSAESASIAKDPRRRSAPVSSPWCRWIATPKATNPWVNDVRDRMCSSHPPSSSMTASASDQAPKRESRVDEAEEDLLPVPVADPTREREAVVDVALRLRVPIVLGQEVDEVVVRAQRGGRLVVLDGLGQVPPASATGSRECGRGCSGSAPWCSTPASRPPAGRALLPWPAPPRRAASQPRRPRRRRRIGRSAPRAAPGRRPARPRKGARRLHP